MHAPRRLAPWLLTPALLLAGCASPDRVVFVTSTELGIGADATTGTANVGYDRNEGVIGPAYPETGALPPVYARIQTDGALFQPKIRQLYATGDAARIATGSNGVAKSKPLSGERRLMFFGTTTNTGLKLSFAGGQPQSINFGFKRKEFSILPLREQPAADQQDEYGSLIASYSSAVRPGVITDSGLDISQFIATGTAAENLAADSAVRTLFADDARESLSAAAKASVVSTRARVDRVTACVATPAGGIDTARRDALVAQAMQDGGVTDGHRQVLAGATSQQQFRERLTGGAMGALKALDVAAVAHGELCGGGS